MGERLDLPRVPSTTKPSFWNHDTAKWALMGNIAGNVIGLLIAGTALFSGSGLLAAGAFLLAPVFSLGGTYLGAKHGATIGAARQERELTEGRVVKDPSYLNKGIVSGLVVGNVASAALSLLGFGLPWITITSGLGLIGAAVGSFIEKQNMSRDYDHAVALRNQQQGVMVQQPVIMQGQTMTPTVGQGQYMNSVSPQESQALETQLAAHDASHAQQVLDQQAQQPLNTQR